jgi:hypothetical protein
MRDESDDSCARCGRRGRDFGYAEPAAWILDTARWQCRLCACVAACGGWREALLELQRGALHTKGGTPAGSRVTLRELSRAACVREVEAFERGERLPLGRREELSPPRPPPQAPPTECALTPPAKSSVAMQPAFGEKGNCSTCL